MGMLPAWPSWMLTPFSATCCLPWGIAAEMPPPRFVKFTTSWSDLIVSICSGAVSAVGAAASLRSATTSGFPEVTSGAFAAADGAAPGAGEAAPWTAAGACRTGYFEVT